jgi:hypothetical protein
MKSIFPKSIDGDILSLVHLSNGFKSLSATPLAAGDIITSEASIKSVKNSETGKTVKVVGTIFKISDQETEGKGKSTSTKQPVFQVESEFFFRGKFNDFGSGKTFEKIEEPTFAVDIKDKPLVEVLKSKSWFHPVSPVNVSTKLFFTTSSSYTFSSSSSYSALKVTGFAHILSPNGKDKITVAKIDYESDDSIIRGNPVLEWLKRNGEEIDTPIMFESGGYKIGGEMLYTSPESNEGYSAASEDWNP